MLGCCRSCIGAERQLPDICAVQRMHPAHLCCSLPFCAGPSGTTVSTSPACDYNPGPGERQQSSSAFDCVCVKDAARVQWRSQCTDPDTPAAKLPNLCRISFTSEDLSQWVAGYAYSDSCLIPGRTWGRLGASTPPITQVTGNGNGEGMDNASMGSQSHKLQVLCIV